MNKSIYPIVFLLSSGPLQADIYLELGMGKNYSFDNKVEWVGGSGIACSAALRYETDNFVFQYLHLSQCDVGPPFNDDLESSVDNFSIIYRIKVK